MVHMEINQFIKMSATLVVVIIISTILYIANVYPHYLVYQQIEESPIIMTTPVIDCEYKPVSSPWTSNLNDDFLVQRMFKKCSVTDIPINAPYLSVWNPNLYFIYRYQYVFGSILALAGLLVFFLRKVNKEKA